MTTRTGHDRSRTAESVVRAREASHSIADKAAALRITLIMVGVQLLFRLMLLLRRWNY